LRWFGEGKSERVGECDGKGEGLSLGEEKGREMMEGVEGVMGLRWWEGGRSVMERGKDWPEVYHT
jgi:hypothetical protein